MLKYYNNKVLLYVVIAAIVFFMFILPELEKCYARDNKIIQEKMASLGAISNKNITKFDKLKCLKYAQSEILKLWILKWTDLLSEMTQILQEHLLETWFVIYFLDQL